MHVCAGAGHEHLVTFLARRGCGAAVADKRGDTPLFWAARNGHGSTIRCLLAHMAKEASSQLQQGRGNESGGGDAARIESRNQMTSINWVNNVGISNQ